jgi:hypothetical protein
LPFQGVLDDADETAVDASGWKIAGLNEYGATDPMSAVAVLADSF